MDFEIDLWFAAKGVNAVLHVHWPTQTSVVGGEENAKYVVNMAHVPHQHFAAAYKVDAAAASVLYSELKQEVVCVKVSPRQMSFLSFAFLPFH